MKKAIIISLLALVSITGLAQNKIGILAGTMWRNEQTGDWDIGFTEKYAIYDCRLWDYGTLKRKNDKFEVTLINQDERVKVTIGAQKDEKRQMMIVSSSKSQVPKGKKQIYSLITTKTLPNYPNKDLAPFKDNGYREGDTATIVGWLKDFPKEVLDRKRKFEINNLYNIFTNTQTTVSGDIDDEGRFVVKVPVENAKEVYADWRRSNLQTVLEPGETYFFLYDGKTNQKLFMGRNARVQNELLAHNYRRAYHQTDEHGLTDEQLLAYKDQWVSMYEKNNGMIDSILNTNPTLSRKFEDYHRMSNLCTMAQELTQSRMYGASGKLPQAVTDYVNTTLWSNIIKPYTISREMSWLIYYYSLMAEEDNPNIQQKKTFDANNLLQMAEDGEFQASAEDIAFLKRWQRLIEQLKQAPETETPVIEAQNKKLIEEVNEFAQRPDVQTLMNDYFNAIMNEVKVKAETTDAVFTDPVLRDMAKSQMLTSHLQRNRMPLTPDCIEVLQEIQLSAARNAVLAENNKFVTVQQAEVPYPASLRPSSDVEGLTDGEAIFRKIVEPFKGRIVYLDIWGTWCGPCREKLAESPFVKSQLKEFDIVYLYLANRSPDDAWKSVIKEYDLSGENCVHYNLPAAQQRAVEEFLKVEGFPTYKLIDKQGNIHDLEWLHTSNMDFFKETLSKLSK